MTTSTVKPFIHTILITFSLFSGAQALAASACKGQTDTACNQNNSCYWVSEFKRSDGANVKGHCRAKPNASLKEVSQKPIKKEPTSTEASLKSSKKVDTKIEDMKQNSAQ